MKNIIIALIISVLFSCKENNKAKDTNENSNKVEVKKTIPVKKVETVLDYIDFGNKKRATEVNDKLGGIIGINKVYLFREELSKKVFIILKLEENLSQNDFNDYTIVSRMFPYFKEDLRPESIERNLEFDSWYFPIKIRESEGVSYIYAQVSDDVDGFKKVILQLINKNTNEISPKKIIIENLEG